MCKSLIVKLFNFHRLELFVKDSKMIRLPYPNAVFFRNEEFVAFLNIKGFVPLVHVNHRTDGSGIARRMRVRQNYLFVVFRTNFYAPYLGQGEEESLVGY